jgi:hypothetical protein
VFTKMLCGNNLTQWPWTLTLKIKINRVPDSPKYVPSLVKIHWRMLILECSQGCYAVRIWPGDLWSWKSIGFQTLLGTMYVPSLVKIHSKLILECLQGCYTVKIWPCDIDLWPTTLKINRFPNSPKDLPSLVKIHWRILILKCSQGCYPVTLTFDLPNQ